MKKLLHIFILSISLLILGSPMCAAAQPQRVAILPVFWPSHIAQDQEVDTIVTQMLTQKFHTSLSDILPTFELIPGTDIIMSLKNLHNDTKPDKQLLMSVANELNADIVIAANIKSFRNFRRMRWDGDWFQETDLAVRIISYRKSSQAIAEYNDQQSYAGRYLLFGLPDHITKEVMYRIINKMPNSQQ